jgi:aspartyl-tRNA(Asn)/glutamyl-tRNA(Gln) amidotransferase subunit A
MADTELHALTIAELAPLLKKREISPVELTAAYLERIDAVDSTLNAYITIMADAAQAQAQERDAELMAGEYRGPLHGVPIALKDLYDTAGVPTTAGSRIFADRVPDSDASTVSLLRAAGAIIIGKTNLHEFAYGVTNDTSYFGATRNPWDPERVPGGSSGGSGAAVAAGLCAAATGTDTGGSIRMPAALCGIVGLKPTYGRVSCAGVIPLAWSLDHCGPLTRSVMDAAIMLFAMAGWDPQDPATLAEPVEDYLLALRPSAEGLRIAVDPAYSFSRVDPEVEAAVKDALAVLQNLGAKLVEVELPRVSEAAQAALTVLDAEATSYHEQFLKNRPEDYQPTVRDRLGRGFQVRGIDYALARRVGQWMALDFETLFDDVDLIATPATAIPAPKLGQEQVEIGHENVDVRGAVAQFTRVFNLTGLPAISVPCGFSSAGLPIGLQLAGAQLDEATVLRAAHAYEQATDWHTRHPELG